MACRRFSAVKTSPATYYFFNFVVGIAAFITVQFFTIPSAGITPTLALGAVVSLIVATIAFLSAERTEKVLHTSPPSSLPVENAPSPALIAVAGASGFCATVF